MHTNGANVPARVHRGAAVPARWRSRRHPVFALLRADGRHMGWLAQNLRPPYSHAHVKSVSAGIWPASPRFRAACCALFGRDETELFHEHDGDSSARPRTEAEIVRAGPAVGAGYRTAGGLSIPEEEPQTRSA